MIEMIREWTGKSGEKGYYILYASGRMYYKHGENRLPESARVFMQTHTPSKFFNTYFDRWENTYRAQSCLEPRWSHS